jgi:hypothetical protein
VLKFSSICREFMTGADSAGRGAVTALYWVGMVHAAICYWLMCPNRKQQNPFTLTNKKRRTERLLNFFEGWDSIIPMRVKGCMQYN